jgi:hypothetical protein
MRIKLLLTILAITSMITAQAQTTKQPALITMKSGETIDAIHFGQLKCGKEIYSDNYVIIRGKYMDAVTEIKDYKDIEKIVLEGYKKEPVNSIGNEQGILHITKKNGVSATLTDAEIAMSCYAPGDRYNEVVVQIFNPLTDQPAEKALEVRNIQSIIFK